MQKKLAMKRIIITTMFALIAGWLSAQEPDLLLQPTQVVAKYINSSGGDSYSYTADFTYDEEAKLESFIFHFPDYERRTFFTYDGSNCMTQRSSTQVNSLNNVWYFEWDNFDYNSQHRLIRQKEYTSHSDYSDMEGLGYNYQYDTHGRIVRKELCELEGEFDSNLINYWTYDYENRQKDVTITMYDVVWENKGQVSYINKVHTYHYSDDYVCLSSQTDTYNHDGEITDSELLSFNYNEEGLLESTLTQKFADGDWTKLNINCYSYDDHERCTEMQYKQWNDTIDDWTNQSIETTNYDEEGRVTERDRGLWSSDLNDWSMFSKTIYDYDQANMLYTVSFYKYENDEWLRDTYKQQPVFFDHDLEWQEKCLQSMKYENLYQHSPKIYYNQLEIVMTQTERPEYMSVDDNTPATCIVYPNPGSETVTVKSPTENAVVRFYDIQGRLVLAKPFDLQTDINAGDWAPGIYLWEIWKGPQKESSGKWIKKMN